MQNFKKKKLYVLFIDFSKAYDRVPRNKLVGHLKSLGCSYVMPAAIKAIYKCACSVLRSATMTTTIGVRQGAPTNCLLFVVYIDKLVRMLKQAIPTENFLGNLHCVLLMDDAVILVTSRDMCQHKLEILMEYCDKYGMVLNEKKSKFFVVNSVNTDKQPLVTLNLQIMYCPKYIYLGVWFTDDAKISSVLSQHEAQKSSLVNKFAVFCAANTSYVFCI